VLAADYRASALGDALGAPERDQLVAWLKANTTGGERPRGLPASWVTGGRHRRLRAIRRRGAPDSAGTVVDLAGFGRPGSYTYSRPHQYSRLARIQTTTVSIVAPNLSAHSSPSSRDPAPRGRSLLGTA
jgi:hypothetical protein